MEVTRKAELYCVDKIGSLYVTELCLKCLIWGEIIDNFQEILYMFPNKMASRLLLNLLYAILHKEIENSIYWQRYFFVVIEHVPL